MRKTTLFAICSLAALAMATGACRRSGAPVYSQFSGPEQTDDWDPFEELSYSVRFEEPVPPDAAFDLTLTVRHAGYYPSDRVRLIITPADDIRQYRPDTVTVILADKDGKWKGNRNFSIYSLSTLISSDFKPGPNCTFSIRPDSPQPLSGISKIGLSLSRHDNRNSQSE